MTFADWLSETAAKVDAYGPRRGLRSGAFDFWGGALRHGCHTFGLDDRGTHVYDREWDVLVLLDTCRPDVLAEVAPDYPFLPEPGRIPTLTSVGSTSWEWLHDTFAPDRADSVRNTAYVTGNAHTHRFGDEFPVDPEAFGLLDEVWRYGWDDEFSGMPPRPITDRAVAVGRRREFDRMVVHYMQPHSPYRSLDVERDVDRPGEANLGVWDLLQDGTLPVETAWDAYRDNLRWVLDDLELLLENLDADTVVVSSDHGEAFGEWGLYGHYRHVPVGVLRTVPWVELSATDEGTYEPTLEPPEVDADGADDPDDDETAELVEERLTALGYR
ncbi:hypothetical protein [Candidatus Halobonum tyrrellensis]|uniref:Sulfatase N-terminal domain-containing protein n=1 Tax=Candidatus Halobonum tyrrellensis G22 TaxID=1324957 RepID=V4J0N3_9EURY|nr:hypothetical protein [Candidatus Halobonum tyrrellensis]ESP89032.1 hypothetical protein K933_06268 [Candidatus Halobonum tyrrellensis G22]